MKQAAKPLQVELNVVCRAAAASNIAHRAAIHKSEAVLSQAVEKADIAREEAKAAEREAAEKAAHATAQEEVSTSQAAVSEQVHRFDPDTCVIGSTKLEPDGKF